MTRTCLVLLVTLVLCGCSGPTVCLDAVGLAAGVPIQREIVGKSVEGRPLECIALGAGGDVTFVLAAIHGDEPAGVGLVYRLAGHLQRQRLVV